MICRLVLMDTAGRVTLSGTGPADAIRVGDILETADGRRYVIAQVVEGVEGTTAGWSAVGVPEEPCGWLPRPGESTAGA